MKYTSIDGIDLTSAALLIVFVLHNLDLSFQAIRYLRPSVTSIIHGHDRRLQTSWYRTYSWARLDYLRRESRWDRAIGEMSMYHARHSRMWIRCRERRTRCDVEASSLQDILPMHVSLVLRVAQTFRYTIPVTCEPAINLFELLVLTALTLNGAVGTMLFKRSETVE